MASQPQDLTAVLPLLCAALAAYGCPALVISDHGAVFRAEDSRRILRALAVAPPDIAPGKPWQNLIETQLKGQRRLADCKCAHAQTFAEIQTLHAAVIETGHTTRHWAHQDREDGRRPPVDVVEWVRGRPLERAHWPQLCGAVQLLRTVHRDGFISGQRLYLYAAPGLSRERGALWIYAGELRIAYQATRRARSRCVSAQRQRRLREVSHPTVYPTVFASPQLALLALEAPQWRKVQQRAAQRRARRVNQLVEQRPLLPGRSLIFLWSSWLCEGVGKHVFPYMSTVM